MQFGLGGTEATGTFALSMQPPAFVARWTVGDVTTDGVGLQMGDRYGFATGAGCGVALLSKNDDGSYGGVWVPRAGATPGTLTLRRTQ